MGQNNSALINSLIKSLSPKLKTSLIGVDLLRALNACVTIINKWYNNILRLILKPALNTIRQPYKCLLSYYLSLSTLMLQILILEPQDTPHQGLLNKNDALSQASVLNVEVTLTSLTTASPLYLNIIYKQLILTAVYHTNLLVTIPNLYLVLALYLVNTTYKDKALTNAL